LGHYSREILACHVKIPSDANADMVLQRLIEYIDKEILACHVKIQSDANADMVIQTVIELIWLFKG